MFAAWWGVVGRKVSKVDLPCTAPCWDFGVCRLDQPPIQDDYPTDEDGGFLQLSRNLHFTWRFDREAGPTVVDISIAVGSSPEFTTLDLNDNTTMYTFATNSYIANGGNGYTMMKTSTQRLLKKQNSTLPPIYTYERDVVEQYLDWLNSTGRHTVRIACAEHGRRLRHDTRLFGGAFALAVPVLVCARAAPTPNVERRHPALSPATMPMTMACACPAPHPTQLACLYCTLCYYAHVAAGSPLQIDDYLHDGRIKFTSAHSNASTNSKNNTKDDPIIVTEEEITLLVLLGVAGIVFVGLVVRHAIKRCA